MNKTHKQKKPGKTMKRVNLIFLFAILFIVLQLSSVLADGGYIPRPGYWVRPGQQRAIILHEENTETMILTSSFQGNAKDLVWIVPTPTRPKITKANEEVFTNMAKLAIPEYSREIGLNYRVMMEATTGKSDISVAVIESKQVDYYDINVLIAANSQDLVTWFNDNNYDYPEEYGYVLQHYINNGWFFTAIKISPEAQGATEVIQDLKEGNPTPIKMVFLSNKIVFPLKISSIDFKPEEEENYYYRYNNYIPIQLYILADSKYEHNQFNTIYGNWVKKTQIEKLADDGNGNPLIQPKNEKYFLTSLNTNIQKSQMDDDIFLKKAENNKKVNAGPETWQLFLYGLLLGSVLFMVWVFTPMGIMFIAGSLILFLSSNKTARILGGIMEVCSIILTLIVGLLFFIIATNSGSLGNYVVISFLTTCLFIFIINFIIIGLQRRYKK